MNDFHIAPVRRRAVLLFGLILCAGAFLVHLDGCGGRRGCGGRTRQASTGQTSTSPAAQKIQHVVVIFQENRTPDNLFHGLPNADIANSGQNSQGQTVPLTPVGLATGYDLNHKHAAFLNMYDGGKMDGADKNSVTCNGKPGCPANAQFQYVNPSEVAPYFQLATQYTFADRMFQTNQGPSFPAHQFIISGTSTPDTKSDSCAAENPSGVPNAFFNTGCTAPAGEFVALIDPSGKESSTQYPCFEHPTLPDSLNAKKVSWRYYTPTAGIIWTGPNAIKHMCVPDATGTVCTGSDWTNNVILQQTQVLTDIANGQLPAVSWVIPTAQASDHPQKNDGSGPSWVASVVNAIGNSPYWSNTAIFITWDDWGGWYDHVAPPIINSYEYGFRVPLIVVSPYAKPGYVSHQKHDFGSILRFIEEVYGLPSLGYADANADDLADTFNFQQTPLTFHPVAALHNANYFLNDKRPPAGPDDD
jgi:phospholipase C